jgi:hypothetical protein
MSARINENDKAFNPSADAFFMESPNANLAGVDCDKAGQARIGACRYALGPV